MDNWIKLPDYTWWQRLKWWWITKWSKRRCDGCNGNFKYYKDGDWFSGDWWFCHECGEKYMRYGE